MTTVLEKNFQQNQLQETIDRFQQEVQQLRAENQRLQAQGDSDQALQQLEAEKLYLQQSVAQLTQERDDLKKGLDGLPLDRLYDDLEKLSGERDSLRVAVKDLQQENISLKEHVQRMAEVSPLADLNEWVRCQRAINYVRIKEAQVLARYWQEGIGQSETAAKNHIKAKTSAQVPKDGVMKAIFLAELLSEDFNIDGNKSGEEIAREVAGRFSEKGFQAYLALPSPERKAIRDSSSGDLLTSRRIGKLLAIWKVQSHSVIPDSAKQHMKSLDHKAKASYASKLNEAIKAAESIELAEDFKLAENVLKTCNMSDPGCMKIAVENVKNLAKIAKSGSASGKARDAAFESVMQGNSKKLADVAQAIASQEKAVISLVTARAKATAKLDELFVATDAKSVQQRELIKELEVKLKESDRVLVNIDENTKVKTYIQLSLFEERDEAPISANSKGASSAKQAKKNPGSKTTSRKSRAGSVA